MPISLVGIEEIPLSSSAVYKKMEKGLFPSPIHLGGRSWWLQDEVDVWFHPQATVDLILECKGLLPDGFTEAEMRTRVGAGLRNRGLNERALRILVERGMLERKKLLTGGRPRVEYRWTTWFVHVWAEIGLKGDFAVGTAGGRSFGLCTGGRNLTFTRK